MRRWSQYLTVAALLSRNCTNEVTRDDRLALDKLLAQLRRTTVADGPSIAAATLTTTDHRPSPPVRSQKRNQLDASEVESTPRPFGHSAPVQNPYAGAEFPQRRALDWTVAVPALQEVINSCEQRYNALCKRDHDETELLVQCVQPLLFRVGYPLEVEEIRSFLPFLETSLLESALVSKGHQAGLFVFRNRFSHDRPTVLDASVEGFYLHVYECIHYSWEPIEVVLKRLGFAANVAPAVDMVRFLSCFSPSVLQSDGIEIGVLHKSHAGFSAVLVENISESASWSTNTAFVVRRKRDETSNLSVVETVRMLGDPFVAPPKKSKTQIDHNVGGIYAFACAVQSKLDSTPDVDKETLSKWISASVPLEQSQRVRLSDFSIPSRYTEGKATPTADQRKQSTPKENDVTKMRTPLAQSASSPATKSTTENSKRPTKSVHDLKVRIVTLKQRAKLAQGNERVVLLSQLSEARTALLAATDVANEADSSSPQTSPSAVADRTKAGKPQRRGSKGTSPERKRGRGMASSKQPQPREDLITMV